MHGINADAHEATARGSRPVAKVHDQSLTDRSYEHVDGYRSGYHLIFAAPHSRRAVATAQYDASRFSERVNGTSVLGDAADRYLVERMQLKIEHHLVSATAGHSCPCRALYCNRAPIAIKGGRLGPKHKGRQIRQVTKSPGDDG